MTTATDAADAKRPRSRWPSTPPRVSVDAVRGMATIPIYRTEGVSAAALLQVGKDAAYAMARDGRLPTIPTQGRRRVVPVARLLRMLGELPDDRA